MDLDAEFPSQVGGRPATPHPAAPLASPRPPAAPSYSPRPAAPRVDPAPTPHAPLGAQLAFMDQDVEALYGIAMPDDGDITMGGGAPSVADAASVHEADEEEDDEYDGLGAPENAAAKEFFVDQPPSSKRQKTRASAAAAEAVAAAAAEGEGEGEEDGGRDREAAVGRRADGRRAGPPRRRRLRLRPRRPDAPRRRR